MPFYNNYNYGTRRRRQMQPFKTIGADTCTPNPGNVSTYGINNNGNLEGVQRLTNQTNIAGRSAITNRAAITQVEGAQAAVLPGGVQVRQQLMTPVTKAVKATGFAGDVEFFIADMGTQLKKLAGISTIARPRPRQGDQPTLPQALFSQISFQVAFALVHVKQGQQPSPMVFGVPGANMVYTPEVDVLAYDTGIVSFVPGGQSSSVKFSFVVRTDRNMKKGDTFYLIYGATVGDSGEGPIIGVTRSVRFWLIDNAV